MWPAALSLSLLPPLPPPGCRSMMAFGLGRRPPPGPPELAALSLSLLAAFLAARLLALADCSGFSLSMSAAGRLEPVAGPPGWRMPGAETTKLPFSVTAMAIGTGS